MVGARIGGGLGLFEVTVGGFDSEAVVGEALAHLHRLLYTATTQG
jgi:hypothetical protein